MAPTSDAASSPADGSPRASSAVDQRLLWVAGTLLFVVALGTLAGLSTVAGPPVGAGVDTATPAAQQPQTEPPATTATPDATPTATPTFEPTPTPTETATSTPTGTPTETDDGIVIIG